MSVPKIGPHTRDERIDARTFDGFTASIQELAEHGYLAYTGDGTDKLHLTRDGLHALMVLHAHATATIVNAAAVAVVAQVDTDEVEALAVACARVTEFLRGAERAWGTTGGLL